MALCSNSLVCLELCVSLAVSVEHLTVEVESMQGSMAEMISYIE